MGEGAPMSICEDSNKNMALFLNEPVFRATVD